jgi:hypothetical protein
VSGDEEEQAKRETMALAAAMRGVLVRLLVYEARRHPDQRKFFEELSAGATADILRATDGETMDPTTLAFQEMVQRETDEMLGQARGKATGQEEDGP